MKKEVSQLVSSVSWNVKDICAGAVCIF